MLTSLPISRKLAGAFGIIIAVVLAMMLVLWSVLGRIEGTSTSSVRGQDVLAQTLEMEIAILRQNSQMRGFLITGDESYLTQYREAIAQGAAAVAKLNGLLADTPADLAKVAQSQRKSTQWRERFGDRLIAMSRVDRMAAQAQLREVSKQATVLPVLAPLRALRKQELEHGEIARADREAALAGGKIALLLGALVMIGGAMAVSIVLTRLLARPIVRLTGVMDTLAKGDNGVEVPDTDRGDEILSLIHI